jgi:2-polyprenyl-6-methoxyphenol hydroxylase-like FAD-dependent oxidoreductase
MDVLWFRLPRRPDDPPGVTGRLAPGRGVALLDRGDQWQVAYAFPKGGYQRLRAAGLEALRRSISETAPELADRVECLTDWKQVSLLSVESNRCPRWYKPGLLLIGDAAHVMSPAGGVGINYAIADAVAAANVLGRPLKTGRVAVRDLAAVQRRREWPTRIIQALQTALQNTVLAGVLTSTNQLTVPWAVRALFRIPVLRDLPARLLAFGIWPVHVASLPGMPRRE